MFTEKRLSPNYKKSNKSAIVGERTRHLVTFNPSSANAGEQLYIRVPKLSSIDYLVPGSLN